MLSFILTVKRFIEALVKAFKTPMFLSLFTTLFLIILSGTLFYTNKEGWGVVDAIYFCGVNTNLTPVTNLGKIFTMLYLVVGTGVMFITLLTLGKTMINTKALEERKTEGKKKLNEYRKKK